MHQVLQRYDRSDVDAFPALYAELHRNGLNKEFIFAIVNSFDEQIFAPHDFDAFSIELIVDYIQRTHAYYLNVALPEIKRTIKLLSGAYSKDHPLIFVLTKFLKNYQAQLKAHFYSEEKFLLPYIALLQKAESQMGCFSQWLLLNEKYALSNFMHEHDHSDAGLTELRNTIIIYGPPLSGMLFYRALLSQLRMLERDLHIHGLLEELVLVPKALTIEVDLILKRGKMAKFN